MPPLYPKMRERPLGCRINYASPLYDGLLILALPELSSNPHSLAFKTTLRSGGYGQAQNVNADQFTVWAEPIRRFGWRFPNVGGNRLVCSDSIGLTNGLASFTIGCVACPLEAGGGANPKLFGNGYVSPISFFYADKGLSGPYVFVNGTSVGPGVSGHVYGSWNFHYAVYKPDGTHVVKNGIEYGPGSYNGVVSTASYNFVIGERPDADNRWFGGIITDVVLWSKPISRRFLVELTDRTNIDLRVANIPLILPPRRRYWPVAEAPPTVQIFSRRQFGPRIGSRQVQV